MRIHKITHTKMDQKIWTAWSESQKGPKKVGGNYLRVVYVILPKKNF